MNTIKAFGAIDALVDNTDGIVAPFGELSTYATTFSRDRGIFTDPTTYPGIRVVSFSSKDDLGDHLTLPLAAEAALLAVTDYIADQHQAGNIPVNANKATFLATLAAVPAFSAYSAWEIGELLAGSGPTLNMPDFVRFVFSTGGQDYTATIWFADASFRAQYDEFEIIVVPPHNPIDEINDDTAVVVPLLAAFTATAALTAINIAMGDKPATEAKIQSYTWHDPSVPSSILTASFAVVIYGAAGNSTDNIKDAIKSYLADNSILVNWPDVFPDLYAENEFVFMPRWDSEADAGGVMSYPIYNPTERINATLTDAELMVPAEYATSVTLSTYLNLYLEVTSTFFRSLAMLVVGSPNNTGGVYRFKQRFPDYTALPTTSSDFNRMAAPTRDFVLKLAEALEIARTMTAASSIPAGFVREVRGGIHYVAFNVAGDPYTYLVISKYSYDTVIV